MEKKILKRYPLGNKRFLWKQKDFAHSIFSCIPHRDNFDGDAVAVTERCVKQLKDAGFNMIELGWAGPKGAWAAVDAAEKYKINLIFQDMSILGGMQSFREENKVGEEVVKNLVERLKDKKYTVGFYVWDEPSGEIVLNEARRQMDLLQKYAPDALLFTVALPNYNHAGEDSQGLNWQNGLYKPYIEEFIRVMDPPVLSFDYYPIGDYFDAWPGHRFERENQLDDTYMWLDMGLHRSLALKHKLPFWFYYQSCPVYKCTDYLIFPMVRCFMYAAILHGAKGLQNYTAGESDDKLLNRAGEAGEFMAPQTEINAEINVLGNTLMALESKLVYHSDELLPDCELIVPYVNHIEDSPIFCGKLPKRCSVGELEDAYGNRYAVILNRDYENALTAKLEMQENFRIYEVSKKDGKQYILYDSTNTLPLSLAPGDAIVVRIQDAHEQAFEIEYALEN